MTVGDLRSPTPHILCPFHILPPCRVFAEHQIMSHITHIVGLKVKRENGGQTTTEVLDVNLSCVRRDGTSWLCDFGTDGMN